ncbi:MAG: DUF1295 domain-containing protein [Saprospiraceae bacterium]
MFTAIITYPYYQKLLFIWIGIAVITFFILLRVTAPYGRHVRSGWGLQISNRLGWILMEVPVILIVLYFTITSFDSQTILPLIMISLFCLHYINRTFIFPLRIHTNGKKMPLIIVASAIFFNIINGLSLGYYFKYFAHYPDSWLSDIRFILGLLIFISGLILNWKADEILIHLRKPNETHYVIPQTKLFSLISCPNLFGELIEWAGFALLCWNLPALTFFIWTTANLIPRAISHHRWYKEKFNNYPPERKAIIPFII